MIHRSSDAMLAESTELPGPSSSSKPLLLRLQETLTSCSRLIESGDDDQSKETVSYLVNFLDSVSDAAVSKPENEDAKNNALEVLSETYRFLCSPSMDQSVIDALSFELPKPVSKFSAVSSECSEFARSIINQFIETSSPRDMLSILCEALASLSETFKSTACVSPLVSGLSKVILSIKRRHFEQVKVTIPVIIMALKTMSLESDDDITELENLFETAIGVADSIHSVSVKLEGIASEKLCALLGLYILGLYILQAKALVSVSPTYELSSWLPMTSKLASFLPYCGLSYLGLITGSDVDQMTKIVLEDDEDDYFSYLSNVNLGASLSVIWGQISDEVSQAAKEDLNVVKDELQNNQAKRWQAIGMLRHIFSSCDLPWELKRHSIDFLFCITNGNNSRKLDDEDSDCSCYITSLFSALQALTVVIIYASDSVLRRNAFEAIKRVLADIPTSQRFDILKALITNCDSSSMIAILLDLVREEMRTERSQRTSIETDEVSKDNNKACQTTLFWSASVLELVEFILRPPKGGPPVLPESGDAVLSALNLYRFVLITESAEKTNYTGVLSKDKLQKVYNEWLLPLRTLVTGIATENKSDHDQLAIDTVCALNPVELVLYRCIELVEEKLKHST
ncbi:hypothetical protein SLA2020_484720 [Shorea laevis]